MRIRALWLLSVLVAAAGGFSTSQVLPSDQLNAVRPGRIERMQNFEQSVTGSFRPAYVPAEWGRLVAVQKIDDLRYLLFFQSEKGDLYLVGLIQNGSYLFLDTTDRGGIATVLPRKP